MAQFFILIDEQRRQNAVNFLQRLSLKRTYSVEIKEYRKNRSNSQNRLYRAWLHLIADAYGYEDGELHEAFKQEFLGFEEKLVLGKLRTLPRSTTKLTTQEFSRFLDKVEAEAKSMSINLPYPDDYHYAMGYEQPVANAASSAAGSGEPEGERVTAPPSGRLNNGRN